MTLAPAQLAPFIDHTLLKPGATVRELDELCSQAVRFGFYGVCVNPSLVGHVSRRLAGESPVPVSVVGFPLGATLPAVKAFETAQAVDLGAQEIDMVINLGAFKGGDHSLVAADVAAVVRAAQGFPVKTILETALLTEDEIVAACKICVDSGAFFVKTSTGFGPGGATVEAVRLMRRTVGDGVGVKASGGISTYEKALAMIEAGANRIGASASVSIVSAINGDGF
ncbi:MAG: deoxyribose-phosphate aldolase [Pseudodesulfovibrio sp.]|uniref:Deoxyribose-phosphate aldolase n=1 Tax=Pseudodesulfovibrio aespoeensis (strain ATCC 700646 / DSM 10631 / Aspo-2) TaxID=643562 RepID=E6VS54_PSEA9|nr:MULTISPECIES: deoxyribose-phosphate aldolase [Pseudodesulfovibrio]MBU4191035.1 deoxyribose-phosphate aldolase [Pseudomonadota bacterium]ADU63099.1 deoxyribose-phosphate aldolase [Pseudodesulfovibrio aespoeensis Aspo-2]MBU4243204.1 deoxyribose-phosphate aldolase [Pseudomonadota bacterium]MBU4379632.1 deoxyribose-phosphate aldolase [Pseudomonadota bacterium]MBU4474125.1 deoxyribose-phosphate aldolase [Pseudomonadota bacterium]